MRKSSCSVADTRRELSVTRLPAEMLVPRLHYALGGVPDTLDAFNLMMTEYSRPAGAEGCAGAPNELFINELAVGRAPATRWLMSAAGSVTLPARPVRLAA